ncbi:MAG: cytochrome P450, partial [Candidatus Binatia bacterium]
MSNATVQSRPPQPIEAAAEFAPQTVAELMRAGPMAPIANPYPLYARLRREEPVAEAWPGVSVFVSRYDDVHAILKDHERFSSGSNANGERGVGIVIGRTLIGMDGHEHLKHRGLITPSLAPRSLRGEFPKIVASIAQVVIDSFASRGAADLVAEFTYVYPLRVFTEILGLPPEMVRTFHDWSIDLSHTATDPARGFAAAGKMRAALAPLVQNKRLQPGNDLISELVSATVDGDAMTDQEAISFLCLLVMAGADTTYHLLGSALFALLRDPVLLKSVRADRSRIASVLEETLRWESPVQIVSRSPIDDVEIAGTRIPRGHDIILGIGSANRDELHFPDPDRFDVDRRGEPHLAFGLGRHYCAGSRLAILEATVAIDALLDRFADLQLDPSAPGPRIIGNAFRSADHLKVTFERP